MAWSAGKMKQPPWFSPSARSCRNRRKGCNSAWEQCKAKELFESKSKKDHNDLPVLSATQENGIVFRNDLDIDIKFDTHALSNYKVVSPGDYIISLRSFQGGFELSEKRKITYNKNNIV